MTTNHNPEAVPLDPSAVAVPAKKSKVRRNIILAGSAASLVGIGSTLAANINLNSGENVEFGQGVARTTACDEDGFSINPVTSYDNENSIFRLDYVEVTGLNLTPEGTGWDDADLNGQYADTATAKSAHPGEYYDGSEWKRTCDGVVLNFTAYTDDINYWTATNEGYSSNTQSTSSPIGWAQAVGENGNGQVRNFGFSVTFDTSDDNSDQSSNYGVSNDNNMQWAAPWLTDWDNLDHTTPANSSFIFGVLNDEFNANPQYQYDWRPDAASISKITVSSMSAFPESYYLASEA